MNKIKRVILKSLILCLFLLLLIVIGVYFGAEIKSAITQIKFSWWILLISMHIFVLILNGFAFYLLCVPFNIHLKWSDWMGLSFIANFANQLLPYRPGLIIRYLYLKKEYAMPLKIYAWTTMAYLVIIVSVSALFCILGWWIGELFIIDLRKMIIIFSIFLGTIGLGIILKQSNTLETSMPQSKNMLAQMLIYLKKITQSPNTVLTSSGSIALSYFFTTLIFYYAFTSLSIPVSFYHCMFISGLLSIASIVPITAANIGINESLTGFITQMIYQDFSIGFSAAFIFRVSQWIPTFVLGSLFSLILMKEIQPWKAFPIRENNNKTV